MTGDGHNHVAQVKPCIALILDVDHGLAATGGRPAIDGQWHQCLIPCLCMTCLIRYMKRSFMQIRVEPD